MNWRLSGAANIVILVLLTFNAQNTAAQNSVTLAATTSVSATPAPPGRVEALLPGHSLIVVRVLEESGAPLAKQAVVQVWSNGAPPVYAVTGDGARATFDGVQSQRYRVRASVVGYEPGEQSLQTFPNDAFYQVILKLKEQPSPSANAPPGMPPPAATAPAPSQLDAGKRSDSWKPPGVDKETVPIADGIACPVATVLDGARRRVDELVNNVNRFAATEQVLHEDLDANGKSVSTEQRKFDYVVSIGQTPAGDLDVDESRNGSEAYADFPARIATLGLPTLAFIFHERYRSDYRFECEGLGELRNEATWVVNFSQRPNRPSRIRGYDVNGVLHPVSLKGRAWISADTFQVLRMEADTMKPIPAIKLRDEHQAVEYQPVHFQTTDTDLWLPATAELYFDFRNHKYRRVHSFSSYLLFSVSASEKIGMPKDLTTK